MLSNTFSACSARIRWGWPLSTSAGRRAAVTDVLVTLAVLGIDATLLVNPAQRGESGRTGWLVAGAAASGVLFMRRRYPATLFSLVLLLAWVCILGFHSLPPTIALTAALYATAARHGARRSSPALFAALAVTTTISILGRESGDTIFIVLLYACAMGLIPYIAWTLGHWRETAVHRQRKETETALREERVSVAREIHDILSHSISTVALYATAARAVLLTDAAQAGSALVAIEQACVDAMAELQRLLAVLRAASPGTAAEQAVRDHTGLGDLDRLAESVRARGLQVRVESIGDAVALPPSLDHTAYLIVSESLANTLRHAGEASTATVRITWQPNAVSLTIEDTGPPARPRPWSRVGARRMSTGHGLLGLKERVATHGGHFEARPSSPGFTVHAKLPLLPASG